MSIALPFPATWPLPAHQPLAGRHVRLTPLHADDDAAELYHASHTPLAAQEIWRYLTHGPYADLDAFRAWLHTAQASTDPLFFTVRRHPTGERIGMISILRITPAHGTAELGHIWYGLAAQRTPVNTESVFLLLRHLFDDLGYRRVEWKCNAENARSRAAALRLGFQYEGCFRQHMVVKNQNRDTTWFAMLDTDWPARKAAFERWLAAPAHTALADLNRISPADPTTDAHR